MSSATKKRPKQRVREPSPPPPILWEPPSSLFPSKGEFVKLLAVVAIAASVAAACHYVVGVLNSRPKPFCDREETSLCFDSDFCEPCPENARCRNGELECFHGYRRHGRMCLENREINQTAKELAEMVEHDVCKVYAQVLCGGAGKIWVPEADLQKFINEYNLKKQVDLKDDSLVLVKNKAMENVKSILEARETVNGNKEFKCPNLSAELHKPLVCRARQQIYQNLLYILAVCGLLMGLIRVSWRIKQNRALLTRAEQLYEQVCEILEESAISVNNPMNGGERWVVASWLRDHLLLPKERKDTKLWKKVEELILEDSRIDQYPKLIKGESKTVLEWQVEGSLAPKLRKKEVAKNTKLSCHISTSPSDELQQMKRGDPV